MPSHLLPETAPAAPAGGRPIPRGAAASVELPANLIDLRRVQNERVAARLASLGMHREAAKVVWSARVAREVAQEILASAMDVEQAYRYRLLALLPEPGDGPGGSAEALQWFAARAAIDDACSRLAGLPPRCRARLLRELPVPRPTLAFSRQEIAPRT